MEEKLAIIIQGPSSNVEKLKIAWHGYNLIWSTWKGEELKYDINDIKIFNDLPNKPGVQNIAFQRDSTLSGILKAKDLGFTRVLKWRSDLLPSNPKELVNCFKKESINFLTWHDGGKYFLDYFIEGPIDDIYNIWNIKKIYDDYSEKITTENIFSLGYTNFNFILDSLSDDNEIYWIKNSLNLSTYKKHLVYTTRNIKQ
jgi:hypothetical protein